MTKHTPGPWRAGDGLYIPSVHADGAFGVQVASCGDNAIYGESGSYRISRVEAFANARLIALLPDLLKLAVHVSENDGHKDTMMALETEATNLLERVQPEN